MKKFFKTTWVFAGLMVILIAGIALAWGGPTQPRSLSASDGNQVSSGALSLSSALGQPVAGSVRTGDLIGASGFWVGRGCRHCHRRLGQVWMFIYRL
ncbi:MAG: hypothetical protein Fur0022_48880 [Anaerolineales bacterium]